LQTACGVSAWGWLRAGHAFHFQLLRGERVGISSRGHAEILQMQILPAQITWVDVVIGMMALIAIDTILLMVIAYIVDYWRKNIENKM
jgi:hypothetical protein